MDSALLVTDSRIWTAETEYVLAVASAEAGMGAAVTLAAPPRSAASERTPPDVDLLELPGAEPAKSPADFVADVRTLAGHVGHARPSVVHSSRPTAHLMAAIATGHRSPLVHLRGSATRPSVGAGNRLLYHRTNAVVASSSRVRDWVVEELRVPPGRVHRLLSPVGPSWFEDADPADLSAEFGITEGARVVINVARLAPVKGQAVLLEAMARVLETEPGVVLLLVGEPWSGEPEGLRSRAVDLGIGPSVVFAGRREDVPSLVAACHVCVTSSVGSEENSRAVSEYMASGRPVVGTAVGVIPELIVEGETGHVVPPGEPGPMADAILELLNDPGRAGRMGSTGREVARREFSWDAFVTGLSAVLGSVGVAQ
jgi:glycosyltransferase involved in cell wall biosynthesis